MAPHHYISDYIEVPATAELAPPLHHSPLFPVFPSPPVTHLSSSHGRPLPPHPRLLLCCLLPTQMFPIHPARPYSVFLCGEGSVKTVGGTAVDIGWGLFPVQPLD